MDKEVDFLKYFFKDEKDKRAIEAIAESIKRVKESSDKDEYKISIRELFSLVAHFWYLKNTNKTWNELYDSGYIAYDAYSWADGLTGEEWDQFLDDKRLIYCIENAIMEGRFLLITRIKKGRIEWKN